METNQEHFAAIVRIVRTSPGWFHESSEIRVCAVHEPHHVEAFPFAALFACDQGW